MSQSGVGRGILLRMDNRQTAPFWLVAKSVASSLALVVASFLSIYISHSSETSWQVIGGVIAIAAGLVAGLTKFGSNIRQEFGRKYLEAEHQHVSAIMKAQQVQTSNVAELMAKLEVEKQRLEAEQQLLAEGFGRLDAEWQRLEAAKLEFETKGLKPEATPGAKSPEEGTGEGS